MFPVLEKFSFEKIWIFLDYFVNFSHFLPKMSKMKEIFFDVKLVWLRRHHEMAEF